MKTGQKFSKDYPGMMFPYQAATKELLFITANSFKASTTPCSCLGPISQKMNKKTLQTSEEAKKSSKSHGAPVVYVTFENKNPFETLTRNIRIVSYDM